MSTDTLTLEPDAATPALDESKVAELYASEAGERFAIDLQILDLLRQAVVAYPAAWLGYLQQAAELESRFAEVNTAISKTLSVAQAEFKKFKKGKWKGELGRLRLQMLRDLLIRLLAAAWDAENNA